MPVQTTSAPVFTVSRSIEFRPSCDPIEVARQADQIACELGISITQLVNALEWTAPYNLPAPIDPLRLY
jgi:hypothetical protein